jgi:hypothetical protein
MISSFDDAAILTVAPNTTTNVLPNPEPDEGVPTDFNAAIVQRVRMNYERSSWINTRGMMTVTWKCSFQSHIVCDCPSLHRSGCSLPTLRHTDMPMTCGESYLEPHTENLQYCSNYSELDCKLGFGANGGGEVEAGYQARRSST